MRHDERRYSWRIETAIRRLSVATHYDKLALKLLVRHHLRR